MTLNEAIKHSEEDAEKLERECEKVCAAQHRELAGWLRELKMYRAKAKSKKIVYRAQEYGSPWFCPTCGADQIKVCFASLSGSKSNENYSFCWNCGQRINWEGIKDEEEEEHDTKEM